MLVDAYPVVAAYLPLITFLDQPFRVFSGLFRFFSGPLDRFELGTRTSWGFRPGMSIRTSPDAEIPWHTCVTTS